MSELKPDHPLDRRFTLLRPLGRGGSAEVWLVRDNELEEDVAAKIVPAMSEERLTLLRRECRQARRLVHPNIVRVFDFHRGTGVGFITMDPVVGEPLSLRRGAPPDEILRLVLPIADALDHAHRRGVIHRDVKAGNVVCDDTGTPHLIDFGIAGLLESTDDSETIYGGGSLSGSSPQQRSGDEPSVSDDIYSFGVMLYDLITGHAPGAGNAAGRPTGPAMPESLRSLIERMLAPEPSDRPATMAEVKAKLETLLGQTKQQTDAATKIKPIRLTPPPRIERSDLAKQQLFTVRNLGSVKRPPRIRGLARWFAGLALVGVLAWVVLVLLPQFAARWTNPSPTQATNALAGADGVEVESFEEPVDSSGSTTSDRQAAIDRSNAEAAAGLRRAERADEVDALLGSARENERDGDISGAEREYLRAVALDSASTQAREGLTRVRGKLTDELFERAMSLGLEGIDDGDYASAREALARADSFHPGAAEVVDALARLGNAERAAALAEHGRIAREFESDESWDDAVKQYEQALALDATVRFAREGFERARHRADLARRIDYHLSHPDRLSSDEVLEEVASLLDEANEVVPAGPDHREQVTRLTRVVEAASQPVSVLLESDNLTEVTIYKVGRFGTFLQRELRLRPGTYTVVGSRKGFRDVRYRLVVAEDERPTLIVRCEEKI